LSGPRRGAEGEGKDEGEWHGEASTTVRFVKIRSTGAELAGVHRACSNNGNRKAYSGVWATAEADVGDEETAVTSLWLGLGLVL